MKDTLSFVYQIILPDENVELFKEKLAQIVHTTAKHKSCILSHLFQDINDPTILIVQEIWLNIEDWRAHMFVESAQELTKLAEQYNIHLTIHQLQKIV